MKPFRKYELYCKSSKVGEGRYEEYKVDESWKAYEVAKALKMDELPREKMIAMYLDTRNHLIGVVEVSSGSVDGTVVDPRVILGPALVMGKTAGFILCHNHPSGDPMPSREDEDVTNRLKEAGRIVNVQLLDHMIVGKDCYYSFKEHGLL